VLGAPSSLATVDNMARRPLDSEEWDSSGFSSILGLVYLVIGLILASGHAYLAHLTSVMPILSAILAVLLWRLVRLSVNLHPH
jgi:hypothetical protein